MSMLQNLRSTLPFILASLGFTLIALAINMPLFEWQISEVVTDLPPEVHISPSWTTRSGESFESDSYVLNQVVILLKNGNSCSPEQLTHVVRRSQNDERLEQIALDVNQGITRWLTGQSFTGQLTMAVILIFCVVYIWWFTTWYNRPFSEAIVSTVITVILFAILINVWRIFVPEVGVFVCRPELHGTVSLAARLSKIYYETPIIMLTGILLECGAIFMMVHQIRQAIVDRKRS